MAKTGGKRHEQVMANRWRRRRMCVILADAPAPAAIRQISGRGAFLETNARPPLGATVELRHPEAGMITGEVSALAADGISIGFKPGSEAVAFALAAIGADMTRPR